MLFISIIICGNYKSLIDRYKRFMCLSPGYMNQAKICEDQVLQMKYFLAQECFSNSCNSNTRKEILQLVIDKQLYKYEYYHDNLSDYYGVYYPFAINTGIFLMAVILVKEWEHSSKFIDSETLQQALLFLSIYDREDDFKDFIRYRNDFSNLIIEYSENFLTNNK